MIRSGPWSPSDVLDLAVLGVVSEQPASAAELVAAVRRVGGGARFEPTADVVNGRIAALARAGLLAPTADELAGQRCWRASEAGRARLRDLLMLPSGSPGEALAAVCARLKICFVDRLDPDARGAMLDDLLGAHRRELAQARAALERCEHPSPFVRRCLIRDVERWDAELGWLEALRLLATDRAAA
jgi:DNA-binding PadR family transcriptional regulator